MDAAEYEGGTVLSHSPTQEAVICAETAILERRKNQFEAKKCQHLYGSVLAICHQSAFSSCMCAFLFV